ncbi:MAG TPA: hypothetical protein VK843_08370 [Planctomycetota bacterium]|nr:hypothetical protein [Planctomycetota bacterium]
MFGRFLWESRDAFWGELALCELACASMEEIREALPGSVIEGKPYFVFVEQDSGPARVAAIEVDEPGSFDPAAKEESRPRALDDDLEQWRSTLHGVIAGDRGVLQRRADAARRALGEEAVARVETLLHSSETPTDALLAGAPALFLLDALEQSELGMERKLRLEQETRSRVIKLGISGAGWGRHVSCGAPIRQRHGKNIASARAGFACGMGRISEFGSRFLWYYTDTSR